MEILQMKAEFAIDDLGTIWFQYAANIQVRPKRTSASDEEEDERKRRPKTDQIPLIGKSGK